jgi:putative FmdB family regulatory protein
MPIYEYQCLTCGKRTEVLQRFGDAPPACPECGGEVKKLISSPAFQFKGTGWYVTDYAGKKGGASEGKSEGKPEGKSEGKSESQGGEGGKGKEAAVESSAKIVPSSSSSSGSGGSGGAGSSD